MCIVQKSHQSLNVNVKGQGPRTKKRQRATILFGCHPLGCGPREAFFLGAVLGARNQVIQFCRPPPLRWWENQRMLSSLLDVLNRSLCVIVKFLNKR